MRASSDSSERAREGGRERDTYGTYSTLHEMCTKCAMVVFHAPSVWHMPHVFVRVGNIVRPTWHERSWLRACNVLYVYVAHTLASLVSFRANGLWLHVFHLLYARKEDVVAHGPWSGFSRATDARSGARCLPAVSLSATRTCANAASFASCSHRALLKTWQTQRRLGHN